MSAPESVTIINLTKACVICSQACMADTFGLRLRGLLGKRELAAESGLLITPSSGVHTLGMKFDIDVVAFDRNFRVIGVWEAVGPWKIRALSFRTHGVLELQSGRSRQCSVCVGDQLAVHAAVAQAA